MIQELKPYPDYKDSGVSWLGDVPEHWDVRRNKLFMREVNERSKDGSEDLLTVSQYTGVTRRREKITAEGALLTNAESLTGYKLVKPNDLVMNIMLAWNGSLGISAVEGIASPAYCVFRANNEVDPWFLHYLFRTPLFTGSFKTVSTGVVDSRLRLYPEVFFRLPSLLPPKEEQTAIVRFLDHAERRIRRFIRVKRQMIEVLNEQKQSIIHQAVTRGLDPGVRLKPSGVEWLGEMPEHWELKPIKRLLSRMDYGTSEASKESGHIPILTMGNIQKGEVTLPKSGGLDNVPDFLLLEHHDLLFTRTNGNPDLVGKVGIFRGQVSDTISFASYLVRLRVKRPNDPQWLHMLLNSSAFWPYARSHALVNLQTNLNSTRYGLFPVPVPPPEEQANIVHWVLEESQALNSAIVRTEKEIDLIREYRIRLITDIVTGKLDVRGVAVEAVEEELEDLLDADDAESEEMGDDEAAE